MPAGPCPRRFKTVFPPPPGQDARRNFRTSSLLRQYRKSAANIRIRERPKPSRDSGPSQMHELVYRVGIPSGPAGFLLNIQDRRL